MDVGKTLTLSMLVYVCQGAKANFFFCSGGLNKRSERRERPPSFPQIGQTVGKTKYYISCEYHAEFSGFLTWKVEKTWEVGCPFVQLSRA